ncbi:MAG: class I SAM-dependent rRNA methyltransferase [Candidatus Korarchaeota archaeon]|nr:class I SAM-dependent rRNA methyltransferase [Candidatus Korarchaeota archaeon]
MTWTTTGEAIIAHEGARRIRGGQLNIYLKWLKGLRGPVDKGDLVVIKDEQGDVLGLGFYEGIGAIALRILSRELENPRELIVRRVESALAMRERLKLGNFFRWIHSEADKIPGLIVDVYDDIVVISSTSIGLDRRISDIAEILRRRYRPSSIVLRNDTRPRKEVGLPRERKVLLGDKVSTTIREGGALFRVDVLEGQKTGFFIDQRPNRMEVGDLAGPGDLVLDLFSYTGGFSIHASLSGARAIAVDESDYAIKTMEANAALNSVDVRGIQSRVKEFLEKERSTYDIVIVDPPALAPSRDMLRRAIRTYTAVNTAAMRRVAHGGIMFTSSCSQFISDETFMKILIRASKLAGRELKFLGKRGASPDHPTDPNHPWTSYLKGFLIQVL